MNKTKALIGLTFLSLLLLPTAALSHEAGAAHEVSAEDAPSVQLIVTEDPVGGFNVQIKTENFIWAPENASKMHVVGEGHAHIYLDGEKLGRVYSEWYHLNTKALALAPGEHELTVDLNGNDHAPYAVQGNAVASTVRFEVKGTMPESSASNHQAMGQADSNSGQGLIWLAGLGAALAAGFGGFSIGRLGKEKKS
jgi:hypothetical protein